MMSRKEARHLTIFDYQRLSNTNHFNYSNLSCKDDGIK